MLLRLLFFLLLLLANSLNSLMNPVLKKLSWYVVPIRVHRIIEDQKVLCNDPANALPPPSLELEHSRLRGRGKSSISSHPCILLHLQVRAYVRTYVDGNQLYMCGRSLTPLT